MSHFLRHAEGALHDAHLLALRGIVDEHLHHEAVAWGLGEGVRALRFDRVLGGEDEEGRGHREGLVADGDLPLLHHFQEGGLHLRGDRTGRDGFTEFQKSILTYSPPEKPE